MRNKPAVKRLSVIGLPQIISDFEYWCGADGKILIVEELQSERRPWGKTEIPTDEEIDVRRAEIQQKIDSLENLLQESLTKPTFVYDLKSLFQGDSPWNGNEFEQFILFNDLLYGAKGPYTPEEFKLLCFQEFDKEREFFEKLKLEFSGAEASSSTRPRLKIPENVRIFVWRRDGGKCAKCGSRENLEYDHIIPVAKGGSNTARNIELLCQNCNRSKSDSIL